MITKEEESVLAVFLFLFILGLCLGYALGGGG